MLIVGLSGGIATGKSTVSRQLREQCVPVIDCDLIAHDVTRKVRASLPQLLLPRFCQRCCCCHSRKLHACTCSDDPCTIQSQHQLAGCHGYSLDGLTCSSTGTLDWQAGKAFLDLLQGAWGYRRVLSAFGDTILTPTGTMKNDVPTPCCPSMQDVHLV